MSQLDQNSSSNQTINNNNNNNKNNNTHHQSLQQKHPNEIFTPLSLSIESSMIQTPNHLIDEEEDEDEEDDLEFKFDLDYTTIDHLFDGVENLEQLLEQYSQQEKILTNCFKKGIDLNEYSHQVETALVKYDKEMKQLYQDIIPDYVNERESFALMYQTLKESRNILSGFEEMLIKNQQELSNISKEMRVLQDKSIDKNVKCSNRKSLVEKLNKVIDEITLPDDIVHLLKDGEVNDQYLQYLSILSKKMGYVQSQKMDNVAAISNVEEQIGKLITIVFDKLYKFFTNHFQSIKNLPTLQSKQQEFTLYRQAFFFIFKHSPKVARHLFDQYKELIEKIYSSYYKNYIVFLEKLQLDPTSKNDLIGTSDNKSKGFFSNKINKLKFKSSIFTVESRISILDELDEQALKPQSITSLNSASSSQIKYNYEVLFRSALFFFLDLVSYETIMDTTNFIFGKGESYLMENLNSYLTNTYDPISLLLILCITSKYQKKTNFKSECTERIFGSTILATRNRLNANIKDLGPIEENRPHYVIRRYAELIGSITTLYEHLPLEVQPLIREQLDMFRACMSKLIFKLGQETKDKPNRKNGNNENLQDKEFYQILYDQESELFAMDQLGLYPFFKRMITTVDELYPLISMYTAEEINHPKLTKENLESILKEFYHNWRSGIEEMNVNVTQLFPNFKNVIFLVFLILLFIYKTLYSIPPLFLSFKIHSIRITLNLIQDQYFVLTMLRALDKLKFTFQNGLVDSLHLTTRRKQLTRMKRELDVISRLDSKLTQDSTNYVGVKTLKSYLEGFVEAYQLKLYTTPLYLIYPSIYPVNQIFGCQQSVAETLMKQQINNRKDMDRFLQRIENNPYFIEGLLEDLKDRQKDGIIPPHYVIHSSIDQIEKLKVSNPKEFFIFIKVEKDLKLLKDKKVINQLEMDGYLKRLENSIVKYFYLQNDILIKYLLELEKISIDIKGDGVWRIPNGEQLYDYFLRYHTTTNYTAKEIHEIGQQQVERIRKEIIDMMVEEYPEILDDFGGTLRSIQSEERFQMGQGEQGRQKIVQEYKDIIAEVYPKLGQWFDQIPEAMCDVEPVPAYKEADSPPAYYMPAPLDRSKGGVFYTNLRDTSAHTRIMMKDICYHEVIGHHIQITLSQELKDIDIFRRVMIFTAYAEGYGLYIEQLADEAGWYKDKYERLGFLVAEMWRSLRLVIDTGLHSSEYRWTREQSIQLLKDNTCLVEKDVVAEVNRYIVMPGQACAYKIGQLKLLQLRDYCKQQLGPKFNIKQFHNTILNNGALPLNVLEIIVNQFVQKNK
ncbi:hypothetical protein DFA_01335 [Cavenderia fasciculata]|uniref:DUF885 family protein n=1 Tax=Cavenderia fasciculata TaxID=261658 RepID=F4PS68_CACFS|nr:uncharacterized protein DFA_01335 [Cavenderia fasciculata]EGG21451.1 hypothetical protein DFA_01335 [Cavenderia fasciculata]|eukprot:XP_004359301.1 hypothetical protein DFA_01335 [Cavenderia fasciculata]